MPSTCTRSARGTCARWSRPTWRRRCEAGFTEVRLIHGRGIGVQREIVRSLLSRHPAVAAFFDAPPQRGGWGATVVRLHPPTRREPAVRDLIRPAH